MLLVLASALTHSTYVSFVNKTPQNVNDFWRTPKVAVKKVDIY